MNPEVVLIGLGYIGLPTAALIASNNVRVHGVDINPEVVETINRGEIHIVEPALDIAVGSPIYPRPINTTSGFIILFFL
jgi:UDP-N-acetyl-D-mannosaminuronic acid dehydrogenase